MSGLPPGTTSVTYFVDNVVAGSSTAAPWTVGWDTKTASDAAHTVYAETTTATGTALSQTVNVTVDNTLASTERLDLDFTGARITLDEYAVNGVYAMEAPIALPGRYSSQVAAAPDASVFAYLAEWDALSVAAQDEITAFYSQPLRGSAYAEVLYPSNWSPAAPIAGDPCEHIETWNGSFMEIIGSKDWCTRVTDHFDINYVVNGTGIYIRDSVDLESGQPGIVNEFETCLEHAYSVYVSLGFDDGWSGKVRVDVERTPKGEGTGWVFDPGAIVLGNAQPMHLASRGGHYYLPRHELFHVFQGRYAPPAIDLPGALSMLREFSFGDLSWLNESTAEWAAGYATRAAGIGDLETYAASIPAFLSDPSRGLQSHDGCGGCYEYGASIFSEYLVEKVAGDPSIIRQIWEAERLLPSSPAVLINAVLEAHHATNLASELPLFWKANYLLDYDDSLGVFPSDVETVWRQVWLANPKNTSTRGDEWAPARPARDPISLADGVQAGQDASVGPGGARFIELRPATPSAAGRFTVAVSGITGTDLAVRLLVMGYGPGDPAPSGHTICSDTPLPYDGTGSGQVTVSLGPNCDYAVVIVTNTDAHGSSQSFHWSAKFDRQIVTNGDWKVFHIWWTGDGGTPPAEPAGWLTSGFDDEAWPGPVIRDPHSLWTDIPVAAFISSPGSAEPLRLTGEIWLAREVFTLSGAPQGDATLRWTVDNKATIWINGHQLVNNAGSWASVATTTVPAAWLQAGQNTIAVRVTQDNYPNTWSENPTMFQAELTLPAQAP